MCILLCRYVLIITGHVNLSGRMNFTLNSDSEFTLTCISTGGPATTVTWTRDSTTVITEGTETVLNDPETAQYTHTLNMYERLGGLHKCTVANKVSHESVELNIRSE